MGLFLFSQCFSVNGFFTGSSFSQTVVPLHHGDTSRTINLVSNTGKSRGRAQQVSMLDDATIGGILAGVSGLSLGIGAMIFTEGQQERRRERQAQKRSDMYNNDTASIPTSMESSATITEDTPGSMPSSSTDGANPEKRPKEEVSDDGW